MHNSVRALALLLPFVFSAPSTTSAPAPTSSAAPLPARFVPIRGEFGPGPKHKVRFDESEFETLDWLRESGAIETEEHYGSFSIVEVDEASFGGREALEVSELMFRDDYDLLPLNGFILDGTRPTDVLDLLAAEDVFGAGPDAPLDPDAGLYVVQFRAPIRDEWALSLADLGATFSQYSPMNAFVVAIAPERVAQLDEWARSDSSIQFFDEYHPVFRMTPAVREAARTQGGSPVAITVQTIGGVQDRSTIAEFEAFAQSSIRSERIGPYLNLHFQLDPAQFSSLARRSDVFAIELAGTRKRLDEKQGQTLAGNISGGSPTGPGYLAWLASVGFDSSQFGSFSVNVVDDATSLTGHQDLPNSRIDFAQNPTSQSSTQGGHGFLNAHIVAGFNSSTGGAFNDSLNFNYGLGIAPWAHVGSTAIFGPGGASTSSWENTAYSQGARISSNSWSLIDGAQNPIPDYDSNAQSYDFVVRDARSSQGGNQEYMVIFAAGNDGPTSNTISTPSTAKNILTVGAGENDRQTGTDGCGIFNSGANDVRDVISFSSRGPVDSGGGDGRWKPEVMAPGTHIEAGVPQSNYDGSSVCNQYFPSGQTLYGWSSGTSHSTPAIAGGAALVYQWFLNQSMPAPSPAMNKAVLVNSSIYMTGTGANDTLPSNSQGMGRLNLNRSFNAVSKEIVDQTELLTSTGASYVMNGNVSDPSRQFRVTLVWTDAPGSTTGAPWVNDLDLVVSIGGNNYLGNQFSGKDSVTGGSADFRNNTESVFLPAGVSGPFTITVNASSIAGDGVPGNGDSTDQDFALFVYNAATGAPVTTAAFIGTPVSGLAPLNVNFNDLSSADVTSWSWDFGDGGTSTQENPSHIYTTPGTYSVSLSVVGTLGSDSTTKTNYITVQPAGLSDGSFESQTAGNTPTTPWAIEFGTGHVVSPSGVSSDSGMPTDGTQWCEIAADSTNNSLPPTNPGGVTNPPVGGAGITRDFTYPGGQTTLEFDASFLRNENANESQYNDWMSVDVSDGSTTINLLYLDTFSPTSGTSSKHGYAITPVQSVSADLAVLFPSSTTATVFTLTALVGNLVDDFQPSVGYVDNFRFTGVVTAPVANFTGTPVSGSAPLDVNFTDSSTGTITSYAWNFGDLQGSTAQNPSHTYATQGTYTVSLTVTGPGGSDTMTRTNYITATEPAPVANFTGIPVSGSSPLDVDFTDSSTGTITSYAWNFGDLQSSTAQNPSHTYVIAGSYTVSLTVTGPGGSDTMTRTNYITVTDAPPVAGFTGTPVSGTSPLDVDFTDSSTGNVSTYAWTFGDGGTSSAQNPSYTYATPGTYSVALTVTGPGGSDTLTRTNYITVNHPAPVASFTGVPVSGFSPLDVDFTDSSTGTITSYAWNFGDLQSSTAQNPSHTYAIVGTYTVSLTVTGPGGSDTMTRTNYISVTDAPPVAGFTGTPVSGTSPLDVDFTDSSTGNVSTYAWTFGDGGTSSAQNPSYTYATPGTYTVALTVTGPGGSDTLTRTNYITVNHPAPVASFTGVPVSGFSPLDVDFTDSSTGTITSYAWNFGDLQSSTAQNPSHTYAIVGTYTVSLTVTGPGGSDTMTRTNYISVTDAPPVAGFTGTPVSGISPLDVDFTDSSTGNVSTYAWTFGDGGSSSAQNPSYTYATPGTYTVALTVTGPGGSDTLTRTNYITVNHPAPVASFTGVPVSGFSPLDVDFTDSSTGTITSYAWNFGDLQSSTAQNPSHTYTIVGTYTVSLTVTGPGGSDTMTRTNYISVTDAPPVAGFTGTPVSGIAPLDVDFTDSSTGNVSTYAWTFGDGGTSSAQNPSYTYATPGTYSVALTVTGPGGSDTLTRTNYITVNHPAPVANFTGVPVSGFSPLDVDFTDSSTGTITSYAWNFGDLQSSTAQNPSHTYAIVGTYTVSLTVTGPGGSDTMTRTNYISVTDAPPVAGFTGTPVSGIAPLDVDFTDSSTGNVSTYAWTFGDGGSSSAQNPSYTYATPGTYTVALTVTGPGGSDTLTRTNYITVNHPAPVAGFTGSPLSGLSPFDVDFTDSSTGTITTYAWTFGDGGVSNAQNPSYTYATAGTYTVALTVTGPGGSDTLTRTDYISVATPVTIGSMTPSTIETLQVGTTETVTISGTGFVPSTTVTVDGVALTSGFTVVNSTTITVAWPLVGSLGSVDVDVSNANGNATTPMTVVANATPGLQIGDGDEVVQLFGNPGVTWTLAAEPLDIFVLLVSPDGTPSLIPGLFDLQIGNNSTTLTKIKNFPIGAKGWRQATVPFSGVPPNTTIFWQGLVIDPLATTPLPASNRQETLIN